MENNNKNSELQLEVVENDINREVETTAATNYEENNCILQNKENTNNKTDRHIHGLALGQVERVIDEVLPKDMHISREARIAFQKVATISILYISALANSSRLSHSNKKTSISTQNIREAAHAAGMTHLLPEMSSMKKRHRW